MVRWLLKLSEFSWYWRTKLTVSVENMLNFQDWSWCIYVTLVRYTISITVKILVIDWLLMCSCLCVVHQRVHRSGWVAPPRTNGTFTTVWPKKRAGERGALSNYCSLTRSLTCSQVSHLVFLSIHLMSSNLLHWFMVLCVLQVGNGSNWLMWAPTGLFGIHLSL